MREEWDATAFLYESSWDKHGAYQLEYTRYQQSVGSADDDPAARVCAWQCILDQDGNCSNMRQPANRSEPIDFASKLNIDSTTACAHSERMTGRYLHKDCSACTKKLTGIAGLEHCSNTDSGNWDQRCVDGAVTNCSGYDANGQWKDYLYADMSADHSECLSGPPLPELGTACTTLVCSKQSSCCTTGWTSSCVSLANANCTGGKEWFTLSGDRYGFCGTYLPVGSGTISN